MDLFEFGYSIGRYCARQGEADPPMGWLSDEFKAGFLQGHAAVTFEETIAKTTR